MTMGIVPGSENMKEFPDIEGSTSMGIYHWGRLTVQGVAGCLKVGRSQVARLKTIGYEVVKTGTHYAYVKKEKDA